MPTYYVDPVNGNDANDGLGWWKIAYSGGQTAAPGVGVTITGAGGATGVILSVVLSSGTWAGNNAAGTFYLYGRNATAFAEAEAITWGGGSATNAQGTPYDAVVASFKTIYKTFAEGDLINIAKCPEVAQVGTVTATTNSVSVTGISGWTPAQYDIIRFDTDPTLYMIKAYLSGTITLYRPYRGTTGSGKVTNKLTLHVLASSNDLKPTGVGTLGNLITVIGGMDSITNTRLGFSIWSGNYGTFQNGAFWDISNVGFYNVSTAPSPNCTDCNYRNIFLFRYNPAAWFYAGFARYIVDGIVVEGAICTIRGWETWWNNVEVGNATGSGLQLLNLYNSSIINPKISSYLNGQAVEFAAGPISNVRVIDANIDELNTGARILTENSSIAFIRNNLVFINPKIGTGTTFYFNSSKYVGDIKLSNINGDPTLQIKYSSKGESNAHTAIQSREDTVFNVAAPSVKVALQQSVSPYMETFYIPCDAGVEKTISVYFRKNSNYGSVTLPTMRLRWLTGSVGALVSNVHDEVMADTDDTFVQVSYAVTPAVAEAITMELIFQSVNAGAIAYYDDIGVA